MSSGIYEALPPPNTLGQIILASRLMILAPGTGDQALECSLVPLDLTDSAIRYDALSYVWGTDLAATPLKCGNTDIAITLNLERALKCLRQTDQAKVLWVDAVCINQNDLAERERQVGYMREVYSQATRVIVWLGVLDRLNRTALSRAKDLCDYRTMLLETLREDPHPELASLFTGSKVEKAMMEAILDVSERESGAALIKLFEGKYFQRVWCVQEVVASRQAIVKSGDIEMDFFDLLSLVKYVIATRYNQDGPAFSASTLSFWRVICSRRGKVYQPHKNLLENSLGSMLVVLQGIRNFESTDARDRIFAVLGITDEGIHSVAWRTMPPPQSKSSRFFYRLARKLHGYDSDLELWRDPAMAPNYTKSTLEVYRDFTRYYLSRTPRVLDILSHVQHANDPSITTWPTWVPRFDTPRSVNYLPRAIYEAGTCYGGRETYSAQLYDFPGLGKIPKQPDILRLDGFLFDQITTVTDPIDFNQPNFPLQLDRLGTQLFGSPSREKMSLPYISGRESLETAMLMTMHGGACGSSTNFENMASRIRDPGKLMSSFELVKALTQYGMNNLAHWLSHTRGAPISSYQHLLGSVDFPAELPPYDPKLFYNAMRVMSVNRSLYRTSSGYLGLAPGVVRNGDMVVVLVGGELPFILRPVDAEWLLIGDTYVHHPDLMMGSSLEPLHNSKSGQKPIHFDIR